MLSSLGQDGVNSSADGFNFGLNCDAEALSLCFAVVGNGCSDVWGVPIKSVADASVACDAGVLVAFDSGVLVGLDAGVSVGLDVGLSES